MKRIIIISIAGLISISSCNIGCKEEYCPCPTIDLEFNYPDPSLLTVTLVDLETKSIISAHILSLETSSDNLKFSLMGNLETELPATYNPSDYLILIENISTSEVDTIKNFNFDTYRCDNNYCGRSKCVAINKNLKFDMNGKNFSILDLPINL